MLDHLLLRQKSATKEVACNLSDYLSNSELLGRDQKRRFQAKENRNKRE
jgi:hypothetical protein